MTQPSSECPTCGGPLGADGSTCAACLEQEQSTVIFRDEKPVEIAPPPALSERYEVLGTLGKGGMGVVYKARDTALDELIALKVLNPQLTAAPEFIETFKNEVRLARRIHHPHVARVHDLTQLGDRVAISMEFVDGRPLSDILREELLPVASGLDWFRMVCSALEAAHRGGVVHRDLKPANVLIDRKQRPMLIDFGVAVPARLSGDQSTSYAAGTPAYMAPEQLRAGGSVDARADLHAAGVLLYRMLTGRLPFEVRSVNSLAEARKVAPPLMHQLRADIPPGIDAVVRRCLATDPGSRPASAAELWELLEEAAGAPAAAVPAAAAAKRVIVADDDPDLRAFVGAALGAHGVEVLTAEDGFQAVELAMKEQPDLILLDIQMPVLDGREALRILKGTEQTRRIPVVVMTSLVGADEALGSRALGADGFVNKPLQPEVMKMLVDRHAG